MWTVIRRQFNSSEHHKSRKCTAGVKVHLTPNFVFCWNESTCYLRYFCETMFGLGLSIFSIFYFRNLRNSSKTSPFKITIQNSPLVVFTAFICLLLHLVSSFLFIKNYSPSRLKCCKFLSKLQVALDFTVVVCDLANTESWLKCHCVWFLGGRHQQPRPQTP